MIHRGPYGTPGRVAIDFGGVAFCLIQDVDLFRIPEKHLRSKSENRKERCKGRDGPSWR